MYNPTTWSEWQMFGIICYSFVARHAPRYGERLSDKRDKKRLGLERVFRRGWCRRPLSDKITLPQVSRDSCYSHRAAEELDNPLPCRWLYAVPATRQRIANTQKRPLRIVCYIAFPEVSSATCIVNPITGYTTNFLPLFYHRNVHLIPQQTHPSERFDVFSFVCIIRFSLVCFLYMPTLVN